MPRPSPSRPLPNRPVARAPARPIRRRRWATPALGTLCAGALAAGTFMIMTASPDSAHASGPPPTVQTAQAAHTAKPPATAATTPAPASSPRPVALVPADDSSPPHSGTPHRRASPFGHRAHASGLPKPGPPLTSAAREALRSAALFPAWTRVHTDGENPSLKQPD